MNKIQLIGHLGAEPEIWETPDGNVKATLRIATTERAYTTARGQVVPERTTWHTCIAWGGLAKALRTYLQKGDRIYVEGSLHTREYTDKDNRKRLAFEVDIQDTEFLTSHA